MTLRRTMDARLLNAVANSPEVRPWVGGGTEPLDLTGVLSNPMNFGFVFEHGGYIFTKIDGGIFEGHSLVMPEGRGAPALDALREALRFMFASTDCLEIVTKFGADNLGALGMARSAGFSKVFERENAWTPASGEKIRCDYFSLTLAKWRQRDSVVAERGVWFHERLEELTAAMGMTIPVHEDDVSHNRAVGAAALMFLAGNSIKAAALYNRWAAFAGYPPIKLVSVTPCVIDMDQVIIAVRNSEMEVLRCR